MFGERLGVFGGTFDPPHLGHLILAAEACSKLGLDRLLWVLTPVPPHKLDQRVSPIEHRLAMISLAIQDAPAFELSRVEIDRPGPHYMVDTLGLLAQEHPSAEQVLLIGGDSLRDLPTWQRPDELVAACDEIGVIRRPGAYPYFSELEQEIPGLLAKVRFVDAPLLEIASRQIRRRIREKRPFRYYLFPPVYEYILKYDLYR
jgi:nicotinate-nucleotide adenylyltransferase